MRHNVTHLCCIFAVVIKQKYNMKRMSLKARQRSRRNLERAIFKKELFHTPRRIRPKDAWSIKVDTAKFLVPRLKMFLKIIDECGATPGILARQYPDDGYERWREMVKKMLFSFEYYADYDERIMVASDSELRRVEEGLFLFAKWYGHLWV